MHVANDHLGLNPLPSSGHQILKLPTCLGSELSEVQTDTFPLPLFALHSSKAQPFLGALGQQGKECNP